MLKALPLTLQPAPERSMRDAQDRLLLILWVAFWALMILINVQDHLYDPATRWWEPLLWEGSSAVVATVVWVVIRNHFIAPQAMEPWRWFLRLARWMPLLALAFIVVTFSIRHGVYALIGRSYHHEPWLFVVIYESARFILFFGLWSGVIFGVHSFAHWRAQSERLQAVQKALTDARLAQLRAQLHPHFLFNALNTISALMQTDVQRADRMLTRLGDLLRTSLTSEERTLVPLEEELRILRLYAAIMEERYVDRVAIDWNVAPDTLSASVPALLLQPLLENAFKHGVERSSALEKIRIESARHDGELEIVVTNTISEPAAKNAGGLGLRNCRERLRVLYGERASLAVSDESRGTVSARVSIPWETTS